MSSNKAVHRAKKYPQRTCVGCRQVLQKRQLIRLVRTSTGVQVDPSGKKAGRGAYLHDNRECWKKALKGSLAAALKAELSAGDILMLNEFAERLPVESNNASEQVAGLNNDPVSPE